MPFKRTSTCSPWMAYVLIAAGVYNLAWGIWVILEWQAIFRWSGVAEPLYPQVWQCVGMMVGVYGIGYLIAATAPTHHWPIVLVGLLGKILGPIGFVSAASNGDLPWSWGLTIITNDLIWWVPFAAILFQAFREKNDTGSSVPALPLEEAVRTITSHRGASILDLSLEQPLLLVFVRHSGCTFCRQALEQLAKVRASIELQGIDLAIVHMSRPMEATQLVSRYGLDDLHRFHDPHCVLYRAFGICRGTFSQLLGPRIWWRGFRAAVVEHHGIGKLSGDGFRLAAAFLIREGRVIAEQRAETSADQLDFAELAACTTCDLRDDDSQILEALSQN